jgi:iron complex outermembrane recepter protein
MKNYKLLLLGATALIAVPSQAMAQVAPQADTAATSEADDADQLSEIVVTAQKRSENAQRVPIAVQAFDGQALASLGVSRTEDLAAAVPGLSFTQALAAATPFLRGVGSAYSTAGTESPVAFYVDDVYRASASAGLLALRNVRSLEVLKGPQGTLFGRNATGGVVNIATADPKNELSFDGSISYGNHDQIEADAFISLPLGPNLSFGATGYLLDHDGYGTNKVTGNEAYYQNTKFVQGKLRFESGGTDIVLSADYGRDLNQNGVGFLYFPGSVNSFTKVAEYAGDYTLTGNVDPYNLNVQYGGALKVEQELGDVTLKSITAYRVTDVDTQQDADRTPIQSQTQIYDTISRTFTQEVQLIGPSNRKLTWILGLFYLRDKTLFEFPNSKLITAALTTQYDNSQLSHSYAGFGQATLALGDRTNLTVGLRYTRDERDSSARNVLIRTTGTTETNASASAAWEKLTYRFALDHRLGEDVMVYASYNRGFKSGLFSLIPFSSTPVNPEILDAYEVGLKSQLFGRLRLNVSAYHYDYKDIQVSVNVVNNGVTTPRLLNAAKATINGFDLDAELLVSRGFRLRGGFAYVDGKYDSFPGAPFFTPNAVTVGGNTQTTVDAAGTRLFRTPKFSANLTATYEVETKQGTFLLTGGYSHSSSYTFAASELVKQPKLDLFNASVTWTDPSDTFSVRLWGRNLTNKLYYVNATEIASGNLFNPAAPRTYGVTLGAKF